MTSGYHCVGEDGGGSAGSVAAGQHSRGPIFRAELVQHPNRVAHLVLRGVPQRREILPPIFVKTDQISAPVRWISYQN